MGQYYCALVIDEQNHVAKLSPYDFNSLAKLTEHSWISNPFVNAVHSLIRYHRRKVAWIGDYSLKPYDPEDDVYARALPYREFAALYEIAQGESDVPSINRNAFFKADVDCLMYYTKGMFLLNHSKALYVDLAGYIRRSIDEEGWCLSPLPLLTACGNGRGNGDFYKEYSGFEHIGTWAFDWVEYTDYVPGDYTEFPIRFAEDARAAA